MAMAGVIVGGLFAVVMSLAVFLIFQRQVRRERREREAHEREARGGPGPAERDR
jgi:hypothetical protein